MNYNWTLLSTREPTHMTIKMRFLFYDVASTPVVIKKINLDDWTKFHAA